MALEWITVYVDIIEKLEIDLAALQLGGVDCFNAVYLGRKVPPKTFPCVFIYPNRINAPPASVVTSTFFMPFEIRAVTKMAPSRAGLMDVLERLGAVEKMLIADRQFNHLVENLEVNPWEPESIRPRVRERHEGSLVVTFRKQI